MIQTDLETELLRWFADKQYNGKVIIVEKDFTDIVTLLGSQRRLIESQRRLIETLCDAYAYAVKDLKKEHS